jgi:hypothetical protein
MAAPSYTTDQTVITDSESGTFTEPTSATLGTITPADTDNFIQGTRCTSKSTGASGAPARAGIGIATANQTITTPSAVYTWVFLGAGALVSNASSGGIRVIVGSSSAAYKEWFVLGSDTLQYCGWTCIAVDPSTTADANTGTAGANYAYFGADFNCLINIGKGNPMAIDKIAHGRTITITGGDANGYATFAGIAANNDNANNRWGQFQAISGGYQLQGKLQIGTSGAVADFRDTNQNIVTAVSLKVAASFNAIEVANTSSRLDWTGVNWSSLGTVSRGTFTVTNDPDVNITGCSFTDLSTFSCNVNTTIVDTIFRRCGAITLNGATITGCVIDSCRDAASIIAARANTVTGCTFTSDGSNHAMDLGTVSATTTMQWNNTLVNYATSDGSTGNEAIKVNVASGQTLTINVSTGASTPSVYNTGTGTVVIVAGAVTASLKVTTATGANIASAAVLVKAAAGGSLPANVTVTIVNTGSSANVSHTGHGMVTGDKVLIKFVSDTGKVAANEGVFTITKTNNDYYSYTMASSPGSSPTGTIKATYVLLSGTTDTDGNISMSRTFSTNQPVTGWARKSTSAPYYKQGAVNGTVTTGSGVALSAILVADD